MHMRSLNRNASFTEWRNSLFSAVESYGKESREDKESTSYKK